MTAATVSFSIDLDGHSHSIRCYVTRLSDYDGHDVRFCDPAHVCDLVDTHKLTRGDVEAFEAKAIEAFELKMRAQQVVPLVDDKEVA